MPQPTNSPSASVITTGEPAGIGPDCVLQLCQATLPGKVLFLGDPTLLTFRAKQLGLSVTIIETDQACTSKPGQLPLYPIALNNPQAQPGLPDKANAQGVLSQIDFAIKGCLSGTYSSMVTGPIDKAIIHTPTHPFTGHTGYLAEQTQTENVTMMLAGEQLKVALATCHIPLKEISIQLTAQRLTTTIEQTIAFCQTSLRIAHPKIGVCGLNPHAGEQGVLGQEEITLVRPTLEALKQKHGWDLVGPLVPDTAFIPQTRQKLDAYVALYHDQGLIPVKTLYFDSSVNITLGLPFIRTSVDHGTAYDLAGTGHASPSSFKAAIEWAQRLAH